MDPQTMQPPFIPPPSYRRAPPPMRERVSHFGDRAARAVGLGGRGFAGGGGLGEADPSGGAIPAEVIQPGVQEASPPSTYAVAAFLQGERGSGMKLAGLTAIRAVFILPGLWIANGFAPKESKLSGGQLVAYSLASSGTITLGMLAWYKLYDIGWLGGGNARRT